MGEVWENGDAVETMTNYVWSPREVEGYKYKKTAKYKKDGKKMPFLKKNVSLHRGMIRSIARY